MIKGAKALNLGASTPLKIAGNATSGIAQSFFCIKMLKFQVNPYFIRI